MQNDFSSNSVQTFKSAAVGDLRVKAVAPCTDLVLSRQPVHACILLCGSHSHIARLARLSVRLSVCLFVSDGLLA